MLWASIGDTLARSKVLLPDACDWTVSGAWLAVVDGDFKAGERPLWILNGPSWSRLSSWLVDVWSLVVAGGNGAWLFFLVPSVSSFPLPLDSSFKTGFADITRFSRLWPDRDIFGWSKQESDVREASSGNKARSVTFWWGWIVRFLGSGKDSEGFAGAGPLLCFAVLTVDVKRFVSSWEDVRSLYRTSMFLETSGGVGAGRLSWRKLKTSNSPPSSDSLRVLVSFSLGVLLWGGIGARRLVSDLSAPSPRLTLSVLPLSASESSKNGLVFGGDAWEKTVPEKEELKKQDDKMES